MKLKHGFLTEEGKKLEIENWNIGYQKLMIDYNDGCFSEWTKEELLEVMWKAQKYDELKESLKEFMR